jgi:hypothetical protein
VPGENIMQCIGRSGFVPHAMLHCLLFYVGALLAYVARRSGVVYASQILEDSPRACLDVAWQVPNILVCVPMGLASLRVALRLLFYGDASEQFGPLDTYGDLEMVECFVWFGTYMAADTLLTSVHGLMNTEMFIHHCIFSSICFVMFRRCTAPLVGAALLAQELSTPFLNGGTLLRGYLGNEHPLTLLAFAAFALCFYVLRVALNSVVTFIFLREVYRGFVGAPGAGAVLYPPAEQLVLGVVLVGGAILQCYWAVLIARKILKAVAPSETDKPKAE